MKWSQWFIKLAILTVCLSLTAVEPQQDIPNELKSWIPWVNKDLDYLNCPRIEGGDGLSKEDRICGWPAPLAISIEGSQGSFEQRWKIFQDSWVPLPGDKKSWPKIMVNNRAFLVQSKKGKPYIRLEKGIFTVSGLWHWEHLPEDLSIPTLSNRLTLNINKRRIEFPNVDRGKLWLGERQTDQSLQTDRLQVDVYRLISDGHPMTISTRVLLDIAGSAREINLGQALIRGFKLINTQGTIPALINGRGELIVQARPGNWVINFVSHGPASTTELAMSRSSDLWPEQEVWSYQSYEKSRISALTNLPLIDPESAFVPNGWEQFASFLVTPGNIGVINEKLRGIPQDNINRLSLNRSLWLDFDGEQWRFEDKLSGTLRQYWRLTVASPFQLEYADENGEPLLVTSSSEGQSGIEVRIPQVAIVGGGSISNSRHLAIGGWQQSLDRAVWQMNLPPAYRLIYAKGAEVSTAWLESWGLWDIFWLMLLTIVVWKSISIAGALITLVTAALLFHEVGAPVISFTHLIFTFAIYKSTPDTHQVMNKVKKGYLIFALCVFVLFAGIFSIHQIRLVIHPQLEHQSPLVFPGDRYNESSNDVFNGNQSDVSSAPDVKQTMAPKRNMLSEEKIEVTGSRIKRSDTINKYNSDTVLQTGAGKPAWRWNSYSIHWNSPVSPEQKVELWIVSPGWMTLWRLATVFGLLFSLVLFLKALKGSFISLTTKNLKNYLSSILFLALLPLLPNEVVADVPDQKILSELKHWLHRKPQCHPDCVAITGLTISEQDSANQLSFKLQVDALADTAFKIPRSSDWYIRDVELDGKSSPWVAFHKNAEWMWVPQGQHVIILTGPTSEKASLSFVFGESVYGIVNLNNHWELEGVEQGGLASSQLGMIRKATNTPQLDQQNVEVIEPMVKIRREFYFENEWYLVNRVERVAPLRGAINIQLPLYSWEQVTSPNAKTNENMITLQIPAGQHSVEWRSFIPGFRELDLLAFNESHFIEEWRFIVAHQWRLELTGVPEVWSDNFDDQDNWEFRYLPRRGESLSIKADQPSAVSGASQSFDDLQLSIVSGKQQKDIELQANYRSSRGGQGQLLVGRGQQLDAAVDGSKTYLQIQDGVIDYPIAPGNHQLQFKWKQTQALSFREALPSINFSVPISNLSIRWQVPRDRWILWTSGPVVGPAIIYWGELLAFVLISLIIWRTHIFPVSGFSWFILGLGLSSQNWSLLIFASVWLIVMHWYSSAKKQLSVSVYNFSQVLLATFSVITLVSLVASVPMSLLGQPDMGIMGNHSSSNVLNWYLDSSSGETPEIVVYSAPLWSYKLLMLAWALWLAFTLVNWIKLSWQQLSSGGFFRKEAKVIANPSD